MSNEKTCSNCGFNNTPGSKFCNNCGNKLPLSTHIICPNCQTSNSIDRIFCDNCGTRLIEDDPLPEEPQQEEPPKSGNKGFSLPTRRPGDTGHLDPNVLPEWLATGKTDNLDQSDEGNIPELPDIDIGDSKPLHKLEELTADKSLTDDLPDWLVKSNDSDPIIAAPDAISTELYLDLVDHLDDFDAGNLPFDASDADLPDWLAGVGSFKEDTSITPSESDTGKLPPILEDDVIESESSGLTELFSSMGMETDSAAEPDSASSESDISGLTALFSDLRDDESGTPDSDDVTESSSGLTEWLSELSQSDKDEQDAPAEPSSTEESDWLQDIEEESASEPGAWTSWLELPEEQSEEEQIMPDSDDLADEIAENLAAEQADVPVDFAELFKADDSSDATDLPDWMANIEAADESLIASDSETLDEDLFSLEGNAAQSELDWLMQTGGLSMPDESSDLDIPAEIDMPAETREGAAEIEGQYLDENEDALDWLSDLASLDTSSLQQDDGDVFEEAVLPNEPQLDESTQIEPLDEAAEDGDDWQDFKELLADPSGQEDRLDVELSLDTQVSEWLESAPSSSELGETAVSDDPFSFPSDMAEDETATPAKGFTDWLDFGDELEEAQLEAQAEESDKVADSEESFSEWDGLLSELKPDDSVQDAAQSELPDWISDLNLDKQVEPLELTTTVDETAPVEAEGPLAGLRDVIGVAPVITLIQDEAAVSEFTVTPEQRQQLELLRQLSHDDAKSDAVKDAAAQSDASLTRILLAVLLLAAMLVGFLLPDLLPEPLLPEQPTTIGALTAVEAAAGKTVLVAFEYTPALAGELEPQSQLLLNQLAQNDSRVVAISQHAAGVALAASALEEHDGDLIGYLPGEAVGLRQLSNCLSQKTDACAMLSSWIGNDDSQAILADVSMILVFTGQRDSLIQWVEQVGATTDIPVVVGITQALAPVAAPYYASGQLAGMIAGAPGTAVYDTLANGDGNESQLLSTQLLSQTMGQIIIVAIFIAGLFIYGIIYPLANRRQKV